LVAEDDGALSAVLARGLRAAGYVVDVASDGKLAWDYLRAYGYEVAVLDWNMPGRSGLELVRALRQQSSTVAVLMLTARDAASDRVTALDEGADDYLVKPFDFGELLARVRALQRRPASQGPHLAVGDIVFDPASRQVKVGTRPLSLTATELAILELLLRRSPASVERRAIAQHAWGEEADALGSNTIDVHIARLRAKLAGGRAHIETVRGFGYRIVPG